MNEVKFLPANSLHVDTSHFDLNGLKIRSISMDWAPYLQFEDCGEAGRNCGDKAT
jgi:hypothetical protein